MNFIDNNINQERLKLYSSIKETKKIYLDTNYWIKLRDAEKNDNHIDKDLLNKLRELVKLNKCIIPISEINFWEILKQNDFNTLKESTSLIDELSKGISLIGDEERKQLEFFYFIMEKQGKKIDEDIKLVWDRLSINILYCYLFSETFDIKMISNKFRDSKSFSDILMTMKEHNNLIHFRFKDNVTYLNKNKEKYKNENKSFNQLYLSELFGYLETFESILSDFFKQLYYTSYGKKTNSKIPISDFTKLIYNGFKENKINKELPSFSIFPKLNASIRHNSLRKYKDGNDTIDFLHATAALPYFDFFFTEKELKTIINQQKLDSEYDCIVESDTVKILELLNKL